VTIRVQPRLDLLDWCWKLPVVVRFHPNGTSYRVLSDIVKITYMYIRTYKNSNNKGKKGVGQINNYVWVRKYKIKLP